jgi:hypothetical protein
MSSLGYTRVEAMRVYKDRVFIIITLLLQFYLPVALDMHILHLWLGVYEYWI